MAPTSKIFPVLFGNIPLVEIVEKARMREVNALFPVDIKSKNIAAVIKKYIGNSFLLYFSNLSSELFDVIILVAIFATELVRKSSKPPRFIGSRIAKAINKNTKPPSHPTRALHKCIGSAIISLESNIVAPVVVRQENISKYRFRKEIPLIASLIGTANRNGRSK